MLGGTYPSGTNTYVVNAAATGNLQIEYSRNPEAFALPIYAAYRGVTKMSGYYWRFDPSESIRIQDLNDYAWPTSQKSPDGRDGTVQFALAPYTTKRYAFPFALDQEGINQADFDIVAAHSRVHAQKAMTHRTIRAISALTNTANWGSNFAPSATTLGGGPWHLASAANQNINKTINAVRLYIHRATAGAIDKRKLMCVISPTMASVMRQSAEIIDFIKQQGSAADIIRNSDFFQMWGIPEYLYRMRFVVEDATVITQTSPAVVASQKPVPGIATPSGLDVLGDSTMTGTQPVIFVYKQDGAEEMSNADNLNENETTVFNTLYSFNYEDMKVEQYADTWNRLLEARVTDNSVQTIAAPESGFLIQNANAP